MDFTVRKHFPKGFLWGVPRQQTSWKAGGTRAAKVFRSQMCTPLIHRFRRKMAGSMLMMTHDQVKEA
mgnify:CR=1 FL=1